MKRIDRLVAAEVIGPLIVAAGTFVVLLVGHFLFGIIRTVVERGVPLWAVFEFLWYQLPNALALALPVSALLSSALAAHRMARDNELIAMRAAGLSWWRILRPVWVIGLLVSGASFVIAEYVQPYADGRAEGIKIDVGMVRKTLALQPGKFTSLTDQVFLLPTEIDDETGTVHDLKLFFVEPKGERRGTVALVDSDIGWIDGDDFVLARPTFYRIDERGGLTRTRSSGRATVHLPETIQEFASEFRRRENQSVAEIRDELERLKDRPRETTDGLRFQLHHRISMAVACLAFALLGAPMTLMFRGGASIGGVLAAVLFAFVYYVGMLWARLAGLNGAIPVVVAAWLPTAATALIGTVLLWRRK